MKKCAITLAQADLVARGDAAKAHVEQQDNCLDWIEVRGNDVSHHDC